MHKTRIDGHGSNSIIMSVPSTHNVLVVIERGKVAVKQQSVPSFNEDEILIRV